MDNQSARVKFEQEGSNLTAVQIVRAQRFPVIAAVHRALFALGIIVSSYQATPSMTRLVERMVIQRHDGGSVDGPLADAVRAAILPIALEAGDASAKVVT